VAERIHASGTGFICAENSGCQPSRR
jgi:hypothetical protein